jgi:hypothetical protein
MTIRKSAILGLLLASLVLLGPWPSAAHDGPPPASPALVQDFQDVPTNSPFYSYIHNLYVDGVVSGYTCQPGGPVDPCVPPGNLPYYHAGDNVTRGQNAKFTDNGRRVLTGPHTAVAPNYGLFSAINTDVSNGNNTGIYGSGATGVWGESYTSGSASGTGGSFYNHGGGTGVQFGAVATTATGWGLFGVSNGSTGLQSGAGVVGESFRDGGAGGVFTATNGIFSVGVAASGQTGAVISGMGADVLPGADGLEVGGAGGFSYAVDAPEPIGDTNYSFYGDAHVHGSNIVGNDYESEVVYQGVAPLPIGSVVALDPANVRGGPLGVVPADATNADAAVGVVSYRLSTVPVNGVAKTIMDASATAVQPGDRAYITILGRVAMALPPGAKVGTRLAVGAAGATVVATSGDVSFGRVASQADATGRGDVLVNFK